MPRIALIEDEPSVSRDFVRWISSAVPGATIDQLFTREEALAAVQSVHYDLLVLDIELKPHKNAGVAIISAANRQVSTPVLVISGLDATHYRGVMSELGSWDYLVKPVQEHDVIASVVSIMKRAGDRTMLLHIDFMHDGIAKWKGKKLSLPDHEKRIVNLLYARRLEGAPTVHYEELFKLVPTGKNRNNIKQHIWKINDEFLSVDPGFSPIANVRNRGYMWTHR